MTHFPTYENQYKLYRWTGMAKNDFGTRTERILYGSYDVLLTISYTVFNLTYAYGMTVTATELSFEDILLNAMSFLICLGILGKRIFVLGQKETVKNLYLRIKKDFDDPLMKNVNEADLIIVNWNRSYKRYLYFLYFMGILTVVLFCVPAYMNFPDLLPFPVPYQEYFSRNELLTIVVWQSILIWVGYINFLAYDSLVWGFLMIIATRMEVIAKMLQEFAENYPSIDYKSYVPGYEDYPARGRRNSETRKKYRSYDECMRHDERIVRDTIQIVKQCVVYYREITEEIRVVEKVYSFPLLIHMFGGAVLIGITIVFVIMGGFNTWLGYRTFLFFLCTIIDLFGFCYYGTQVNESKNALVAAVYGCPWYEGDASTEKLFLYTMSMMRNKLEYTSGGFIVINLESYLSLMKLSYNLLALLK